MHRTDQQPVKHRGNPISWLMILYWRRSILIFWMAHRVGPVPEVAAVLMMMMMMMMVMMMMMMRMRIYYDHGDFFAQKSFLLWECAIYMSNPLWCYLNHAGGCHRFAPGDITLRLQDKESDSDGESLDIPTVDLRGEGRKTGRRVETGSFRDSIIIENHCASPNVHLDEHRKTDRKTEKGAPRFMLVRLNKNTLEKRGMF